MLATPFGPITGQAAGATAKALSLRVTLRLNGEVMQHESTKDMIFDAARLVSYISQSSRLLPGDLVLTESPAGNGLHWAGCCATAT